MLLYMNAPRMGTAAVNTRRVAPMSASNSTFMPVTVPSRFADRVSFWIWSRPWWAACIDSLRDSVYFTGLPRRRAISSASTSSGHTSTATGVLGAGLSVEEGYAAAEDCAKKILNSVHNAHGTINGLKVIKLLGCVYSATDFTDQHLVINGASDLLHKVYGKDGNGYHARSALGFAALPTGAAVEVEAIFEIIE